VCLYDQYLEMVKVLSDVHHLSVCRIRVTVYWALLSVNRALLRVCRALLRVCRAQSVERRASFTYRKKKNHLHTRWRESFTYRVAKIHRCLIFIGHFGPKSPIRNGSSAERDLQSIIYPMHLRHPVHMSADEHTDRDPFHFPQKSPIRNGSFAERDLQRIMYPMHLRHPVYMC